mmetsp:Transcript_15522/g.48814  ORF Transcript_15522/g.48814 Transcript_15522/m.48814 type:complete len:233 (-) Transcript_15522:52-750(-)
MAINCTILRTRGSLATLRGGGGLGTDGDLPNDLSELRLVDAGVEVTHDVGERFHESGVERVDEPLEHVAGADDVRQGDAVAHKEGAVGEHRVEHTEGLGHGVFCCGLLAGVVRPDAAVGVHPGAEGGVDLAGGEVDPLLNLAHLDGAGAVEASVGEAGHVTGDRVGLEDATLGGLQAGDLAVGVELEEGGRLVVLAHGEGRHLDLHAVVLGSDQGLKGLGVRRVSVHLEGHG